ncbi:YlmC/YmxH family sporulation protein [Alkaliphilus oremlandii]|uniref:Sporulation protein YlmC/YmxH n=1 Tax=Alkaliphilus oremlandii (strain OhILAs) TaxID=350688 RepID=A8MFB7_ALKOO|nr:YlmC/YmxH family sporulation protein [Alkaliphilus oremlandii]ABW19080.1 Sporulation protein YlmC/YmxH [Alkaliphilus oremlandii OhILAs]
MRLSTIGGKEIVNLCDGSRLGIIAESDLLIDEKTGRIHSLLIPGPRGFLGLFASNSLTEIPWDAIKKIGSDMIIIESENEQRTKY